MNEVDSRASLVPLAALLRQVGERKEKQLEDQVKSEVLVKYIMLKQYVRRRNI